VHGRRSRGLLKVRNQRCSCLNLLNRKLLIAHASSRFAAALRGGTLRATAGRPCLGTPCLGEQFIRTVIPAKAGSSSSPDIVADEGWNPAFAGMTSAQGLFRIGERPERSEESCSTTKEPACVSGNNERNHNHDHQGWLHLRGRYA
jgi:hypothetical protein